MSNMTCSKTGIEADNLQDLVKKMQDEIIKLRSVNTYLESFVVFCKCGNPKLDCICVSEEQEDKGIKCL